MLLRPARLQNPLSEDSRNGPLRSSAERASTHREPYVHCGSRGWRICSQRSLQVPSDQLECRRVASDGFRLDKHGTTTPMSERLLAQQARPSTITTRKASSASPWGSKPCAAGASAACHAGGYRTGRCRVRLLSDDSTAPHAQGSHVLHPPQSACSVVKYGSQTSAGSLSMADVSQEPPLIRIPYS